MTDYITNEIAISEEYETKIFFKMVRELYDTSANQSEDLFRIAANLTNDFTSIDDKAILSDSRIIKILRYCMLPVISQMKLGQLIGIETTSTYEDKKSLEGSQQFKKLSLIVPKLVNIFNEYLDAQRFIWLNINLKPKEKQFALEYASKWTCSLIANQNSATAFRNWRKELQETTATDQIVKAGYTSVEKRKIISSLDDLLPGQFSRECRIKGINVQKADFAIRLKKSKKLLLIEAKAIGVRIDAFKRIKECREKFSDWRQSFGRNGVAVGAYLSGFIPESECQSIIDDGALIFWEHNNNLYDYVSSN